MQARYCVPKEESYYWTFGKRQEFHPFERPNIIRTMNNTVRSVYLIRLNYVYLYINVS